MKGIQFALTLALALAISGCFRFPDPFRPQSSSATELQTVLAKMEAAKPGIFPISEPGDDGALGRNKSDGRYSTVRWQLDLLALVEGGVLKGATNLVEAGLRAMEYGFRRQEPDGGFRYDPIPGVSQTPTAGDLASGASFYLASVGAAVFLLDRSAWFRSNADCAPLRVRLTALDPSLSAALSYLKSKQVLLMEYDAQAPNRLLFDAMGAVGLARYLGDAAGLELAQSFCERALGLQDREGWFKEGAGYDSSYQAVGALNLFYVAMMWPQGESREKFTEAFYRGASWECTRVLPSGEVSTFGNTRVYPGGESFLGSQKTMAALSVAQCFYAAGGLFEDPLWNDWGARVVKFYFKR